MLLRHEVDVKVSLSERLSAQVDLALVLFGADAVTGKDVESIDAQLTEIRDKARASGHPPAEGK